MTRRFDIKEKIAEGGFADVYRGVCQATGEQVALKFLREVMNDDARHRFEREVRLLETFRHNGIIQILTHNVSCERPFYAMPLMASTLSKFCGELQPSVIRAVVRRIAAGLAFVHARNGLHRDIKPDNILVSSSGSCVLGDFGLGNAPECTRMLTHSVCGTPGYSAPELDETGPSAAADMYSLGVTIFQLITGIPPQLANSFDIRRWKPEAPQDLRDLVWSMTRIKPLDRPRAAEVLDVCKMPLFGARIPVAKSEPAKSRFPWLARPARVPIAPAPRIAVPPPALLQRASPLLPPPAPPPRRKEESNLLPILAALGLIYMLARA